MESEQNQVAEIVELRLSWSGGETAVKMILDVDGEMVGSTFAKGELTIAGQTGEHDAATG